MLTLIAIILAIILFYTIPDDIAYALVDLIGMLIKGAAYIVAALLVCGLGTVIVNRIIN